MAFTDHSDLFGSVHEDGVNLVVRHLMRQRPSLFNYATPAFHARPDLFCQPIEAAKSVKDAGNPLFTEQEPLPIFGTPFPVGINFCLQLVDARIDFHPQDVPLPPELGELPPQRFSLMAAACAGIDCPSEEVIAGLLPWIERELLAQQKLAVGKVEESRGGKDVGRSQTGALGVTGAPPRRLVGVRPDVALQPAVLDERPPRGTVVLPTRRIECFCLEVYAVGHFEWGAVPGSEQAWLKTKLDGVEIVDLGPERLEASIECYVATVLRLGILPQVMVPLEKLVLDITKVLAEQGLQVGKQVTLGPSPAPGDVPNNPAVEDDMIKAFGKLTVTDGGA